MTYEGSGERESYLREYGFSGVVLKVSLMKTSYVLALIGKKPLLGPQFFCSCLQLHALENNAQSEAHINELVPK